jgi:phosphatidylserine decarboxylase
LIDKFMKLTALRRFFQQEDLNFLLTNRVPRILLTRLTGRFSRIENRWLARVSIAVWRLFTDLDLSEAKQQRFDSLHDCFTRELVEGARPITTDPDVLISPCDAIVGACGPVAGTTVFQAKGFPYELADLLGSAALAEHYRDGCYATLRLTASMYHRFNAPHDCRVEEITYIAGDTWNVNPIALKRVERLFCRNERATIGVRLSGAGQEIVLVPVAAILVASIRLHCLGALRDVAPAGTRSSRPDVACTRGEELGWFEHGSTILVFAPSGFTLAAGIAPGARIRMGRPLMRLPEGSAA